MVSDGDDILAADTRFEGVAQRRVCEIRSVILRGRPIVATLVAEHVGDKSDAVWRMCVWGTETVMTMRRGGYGDGGAEGSILFALELSESRMFLCSYTSC